MKIIVTHPAQGSFFRFNGIEYQLFQGNAVFAFKNKADSHGGLAEGVAITRLSAGSVFTYDGNQYELVKIPDDGGFNWKGVDGHYKLAQSFYFHNIPTIEQVAYMRKHLARDLSPVMPG